MLGWSSSSSQIWCLARSNAGLININFAFHLLKHTHTFAICNYSPFVNIIAWFGPNWRSKLNVNITGVVVNWWCAYVKVFKLISVCLSRLWYRGWFIYQTMSLTTDPYGLVWFYIISCRWAWKTHTRHHQNDSVLYLHLSVPYLWRRVYYVNIALVKRAGVFAFYISIAVSSVTSHYNGRSPGHGFFRWWCTK